MKTRTTPTNEVRCHKCGHDLDAATSFHDRKPSEGCCSICIGCGNIMIFNADLTLREPTETERRHFGLIPEVIAVQIYIRSRQKEEGLAH